MQIAASVLADAVDAENVAEILDRARPEQRLPVRAAALGPVRDDGEGVGLAGRQAEGLGETEVVADLRRDARARDLPRDDLRSGGIVLVLLRHGERVELRVTRDVAVGRDEERVVDGEAARVARLRQPGDDVEAEAARHGLQPAFRWAARGLRDFRAVHRETGCEHLGQEGEVRAVVGGPLEEVRGAGVVRLPVLPREIHLQESRSHGGIMDAPGGGAAMIPAR